MNSKQLPLGQPMMRGFHFYGYPLSILAMHEQAQGWIHSNFIQLCLYRDYLDDFVVPIAPYLYDYACNPWLTVQRIQRDLLKSFAIGIESFLIEAIDKGRYVHLNVDEYYIPQRGSYLNAHFAHDILVFGYDLEARTFDVLGYTELRQFEATKVSMDEFRTAYEHLDHIENWSNEILLYEFNDKGSYEFNPRLVGELIEDYLFSRNTSERMYMLQTPYDRVYGLSIYPHLKEYFRLLLNGEIKVDVKYLAIPYDHKKAMLARILYLEERGDVPPEKMFSARYRAVEQQALALRNGFLRYTLDYDPARIERIVGQLDAHAAAEAEILQELVEVLRGAEY